MPEGAPPVTPVAGVDAARSLATSSGADLERTMARAAALPEHDRQRGVAGEWSTVESLRHLVLVIDLWLSKTVLGEADPFHPMALPPSFMPPALPGTSIDPDARPTFDEACAVLRGRLGSVDRYVASLTDDELARAVGTHAETVAGALGVLFEELGAHTRFMNRDLAVLESGG